MSRPLAGSGASPLLCYRCEYLLAGLDERGRCPECGLAIDESMRIAGSWSARRARLLACAAVAYLAGALAWWIFGLILLSTSPSPAGRGIAGVMVAIHAAALIVACLVGTAAASRRTKPVRMAIVGTLSAVLLVTAIVIVLAILRISPMTGLSTPDFLGLASLVRAAAAATAAWWLVTSLAALNDSSTRVLVALRSLVVLAALPWLVFALLVWPFNPGWLGPTAAFRNFGEIAMWIDAAALVGGSVVAILVLVAIRANAPDSPRRRAWWPTR